MTWSSTEIIQLRSVDIITPPDQGHEVSVHCTTCTGGGKGRSAEGWSGHHGAELAELQVTGGPHRASIAQNGDLTVERGRDYRAGKVAMRRHRPHHRPQRGDHGQPGEPAVGAAFDAA